MHYVVKLCCGQSVFRGEGFHDVARVCVLWARLLGFARVRVM